jgi:hypothetical protein
MSIRASDLSDDIKNQLLANIRGQVGEDRYFEMVSGLGEDGLLDIVLNQAEQETGRTSYSGAAAHKKEKGPWYEIFGEAFWIPYFLMLASSIWGLVIFLVGYAIGAALEKSTGKTYLPQTYGPPLEIDFGKNMGFGIKGLMGVAGFICAAIIRFPAGLIVFAGAYLVMLFILAAAYLIQGLIEKYRS